MFRKIKELSHNIKLGYQCFYCKKFKKEPRSKIRLGYIDHNGSKHIWYAYHVSCLKHALENPEQYFDNAILYRTAEIVTILKSNQELEVALQKEKDIQRENLINLVQQKNMEVFLDQATGRILLKGKETV
jgi:hypothetical protein